MRNESVSAEITWDAVRQALLALPARSRPEVDVFLTTPVVHHRLRGYVQEIGIWLPLGGLNSLCGVPFEVWSPGDLDDRIVALIAEGRRVGLIYEKGDDLDVRYVRVGGETGTVRADSGTVG